MSALAHYLEEEGIPTVTLSLVREHSEALAPPRALWVPFMLGRPFGVPNDAAFQRKVLTAALRLFEREAGPVLEDFPEEAPHSGLTPPPADLACPVSFPRMAATGSLAERLVDEVTQLQAWHSVAMQWRKHTTLGVTGLTPPALADYLAAWLTGHGDNAPPPFRAGLSHGDALKQACDELKAYYLEAKSAQPGGHTSKSLHDWFWLETACGKAIVQLRGIAAASTDASLQAVSAISLVPRTVEALLKPAA